MYKDCVARMPSSTFMIKKTMGGREGVAIMTGGASQKGDDSSKRDRNSKIVRRGGIYDIKNKRMMGEDG